MCDIVSNLLTLMKPFVEDIEDIYCKLKEKEQELKKINQVLLEINDNSLNILKTPNEMVYIYLDGFSSNKEEYEANKYILESDILEVKNFPQYKEAKRYLENFYKYLLNNYNEIESRYQELTQIYGDKELVNKYYEMFLHDAVFVDRSEEVNKMFDILELSLEDKNEVLIYVLRANNKAYSLNNIQYEVSEEEEKRLANFLSENHELKNNEYNELLDAVGDYVDISKDISDVVSEDLINKINVRNILLAKKVWLYRKIAFFYRNMNYVKGNKILNEFKNVENLYDEIKEIKNQQEVVERIKGDN